jgi:hypothetical protein
MADPVPTTTLEPEDEYPRGITVRDHIAHDMRAGRFPKRSSIETFLKERADGKQS